MLLRRDVCLYEYRDDWEKFNETALPEKEEIYSNLNMEDITDADYMYAKRVCQLLKKIKLVKYQDFYFKSDTLLVADIFKNFRKLCLKIHYLDPVKFLSASGLA